ncbi:MAG: transglutaminase family protein, partial [Pirellulales bacterium]
EIDHDAPRLAETTAEGRHENGVADRPLRQSWYVHTVAGPGDQEAQRAGSRRVTERTVVEKGREIRVDEVVDVLRVERFGQPIDLRVHALSRRPAGGCLTSFQYELEMGHTRQLLRGRVVGSRLECELHSEGNVVRATFPWSAENGGFLAVERSLRQRPMEPGETRTVRCLQAIPILGELAAAELVSQVRVEATDRLERITLPEGEVESRRMRSRMTLSGVGTIESVLWCGAAGEVLKTTTDALSQTTVRATREAALDKTAVRAIDVGWDLMVPVTRPAHAPHEAERGEYEVTVTGKDPATLFASGWSQRVESIGKEKARITVCAVRPGRPTEPLADEPGPGPADLATNRLIGSDDPRVVAIARGQAVNTTDAWEVAVALEQWVAASVQTTDFGEVFASASEVARTGRGDCTEHAVLLAALCRARNLPARVAMGLVYVESRQAFLYHMWNEVWIADRWIPLDATLGRGGIGAGHLKLADSNLEGASVYETMLPLMELVGHISIRPLHVE